MKPALLVVCMMVALAAQRAAPEGVHQIVDVSGDVAVLRGGQKPERPAAFGTALFAGDLIRIGPNGRVVVVCADLTRPQIPAVSVFGVPCGQKVGSDLSWRNQRIRTTRGRPDGPSPKILQPRRTRLLEPRPIIRWRAVPGAQSYRVAIEGVEWSAVATGGTTEMAYPADAPALKPGVGYRAIVEVVAPQALAGASSRDESEPNLGFTLLTNDERAEIVSRKEAIEKLGVSKTAERFLLAHLYASSRLRQDAIDRLDDVVSASPNAASALMLGDLYREIALPDRAIQAYTRASDAADATLEVRAQAAEGRSLAWLMQNDQNRMRTFASQAAELYTQLGDKNAATRMTRLVSTKG